MTLFIPKKPLTIIFVLCAVILLSTAYTAFRAGGQQGQQITGGAGALTIPGLESVRGLEQGANTVSLSTTLVSQDKERVNFLVNKLAIARSGASWSMAYSFSPGLPGTMYPGSGQVVIDVSNLESSTRSTEPMSANSIGSAMASQKSIVVNMVATPTTVEESRSLFDLQDVVAVTPDGKTNAVELCTPMTAVFDRPAMKVYLVCSGLINSIEGDISAAGIEPVGPEGMGPGGGAFVPVGPVQVGVINPPKQPKGSDKCEWTCPQGMKLNSQTNKCEADSKPGCDPGFTYDENAKKCMAEPEPCSNGGTVGDTGKCETDPGCHMPDNILANGKCLSTKEPSCGADTSPLSYNSNAGMCSVEVTGSQCPSGSNLISQTGSKKVCVREPVCEEGFTWNSQVKACSRQACTTGNLQGFKCVVDAKCPAGSQVGNSKKCEKAQSPQCEAGQLSTDKSKCTMDAICPTECEVKNGKCVPVAFGPPVYPDPSQKPGNGYSSRPQSQDPPQPPMDKPCPPGTYVDASGNCVSSPVEPVYVVDSPQVTYTDPGGEYQPIHGHHCPPGYRKTAEGCIKDRTISTGTQSCHPGMYRDASGKCVSSGHHQNDGPWTNAITRKPGHPRWIRNQPQALTYRRPFNRFVQRMPIRHMPAMMSRSTHYRR
jgi:hypothetical protein